MKKTVFVVEDDFSLQELYNYSLESEFENRCFNDGDAFFTALYEHEQLPDLIILDVMLPGKYDGYSILAKLKSDKKTLHIPVIIVSAKGDEISKVKGLNMGADDYIGKPFGVMELVARVRANLRKTVKAPESAITYKDVKIDSLRHSVTVNGNILKTTLKEYNLLQFLCNNAEKVQRRDTIFDEIWGDNFMGESRTLDIHIKDLRKKLSLANSEVVIETVRGVGYMMV